MKIKWGETRSDGYRFSNWHWNKKWYPVWLSPEMFEEGMKRRRIKQTHRNRTRPLNKRLCSSAKARAKKLALPFNLVPEDIFVPEVCPALGIKLVSRFGKVFGPDSPSIDRIIPSLGYTKDNIIVISVLANCIKTNATPEQIIAVGEFYKRLMQSRSQVSN